MKPTVTFVRKGKAGSLGQMLRDAPASVTLADVVNAYRGDNQDAAAVYDALGLHEAAAHERARR